MKPSTRVERAHWAEGRSIIVGADAVGVACLSGPVLAAAVAMPPFARRIPGVRDSKMLSRAQRERLFPLIMRRALAVGIGAASVTEIDRINIYHATNLAMRRAICRVEPRDHVLIDGLRVHRLEEHVGSYTAIVRGDAKCYSIAAASIVAKVIRDRLMDRLAARHPYYGWEHNAGYATATHRRGIEEHGITPFHRRSFARVKAVELGEQMELDLDALVPMLVPA
ncbi:MAG TPA: ribonuclease HII [Candidatus Limnocylindria bacterium]|nr:ribonuclease HII [Candidatus Limnocylindria bacterium]